MQQIQIQTKSKRKTLFDLLYPYQQSVVTSKQNKKLLLFARQLGKSTVIAFMAVHKSLQKPNLTSVLVSTGKTAAQELLSKVQKYAECVKILSKGAITYESNATQVRFSNGSRVLCLPNNPDGARGWSVSGILAVDEMAFIEHVEDIWQALLPTMTRFKDSELIVSSTPGGMSGLFWELYDNADDSWYVQRTTIDDAVAQGLDVDMNDIRSKCPDPDIYAQEYMCQFSKEFGRLIDPELIEFYDQIPQGNNVAYYLGMDIGRQHDRTAITILKSVNSNLFLENVVVLSKVEYAKQIETVKQLHQRYNFRAGYIDEGGIGSAVAEQITKEISTKLKGLQFNENNKVQMYENLRAKIFDHKIKFNPIFKRELIEDFKNVHRIVTETGKVKFEAGRSGAGHSDMTSSLVLAIEAARSNPIQIENPRSYARNSAFNMTRMF